MPPDGLQSRRKADSAPDGEIQMLLDMSYEATRPKCRRKKE